VLRPKQREDGQLEAVRVALEQAADTFQLPVGEAEGTVQRLFRDCRQSYLSLEPEPDPATGCFFLSAVPPVDHYYPKSWTLI
jgi:hypothetical protein